MRLVHRFSCTIYLFLLMGFISYVPAEEVGTTAEQQELNQVMEMMKKSGLDPEQMQQMENLFKNMSEMEDQKKTSKLNEEQKKFEAETAGYGTAQVEVEGKQYELKLQECEVKDRSEGIFRIYARQAPGADGGELRVYSDGAKSQNSVQFSSKSATPDTYYSENAAFEFDGKTLNWNGVVVASNRKNVPLTLSLSCGAEAIFYDKPSRPRTKTPVNVLTLHLGDETHMFEAGHCTNKEYRTGNLMVDFEATATGTFRGRPAIVLLAKSHGVGPEGGAAGYFHELDLLLGELSAEQRRLSPFEVQKQLRDVVGEYRNKKMAAHQKKYSKEMWNTLPQDKLNEVLEASQQELSQSMDEANAMSYPKAESQGGMITITGQDVLFRGPAMSTNDANRAPEFQDLSSIPEIWVTCVE